MNSEQPLNNENEIESNENQDKKTAGETADFDEEQENEASPEALLLNKLGIAENKAAEYLDKLQRALAEFDNFRKRTIKEKSASYDDGASAVLTSILPVIDNVERAISSCNDEDRKTPLFTGVDLIYKQLLDIMSQNNVEAINAKGETFNPTFHAAIAHIDDEAFGENEIVEDMQKGYMYKERVLRHSIVKVAN